MDIEFFDFDNMTREQALKDDKRGRFDNMQVTDAKGGKIKKGYSETETDCNQNYILPILSSCVTAYQRVDLHKDIVKYNAIYCDTDSILTEQKCNDNTELGGFKLEKKISKGWIIRPKCYQVYDSTIGEDGKVKGWNTKVKGIHGITELNFADILDNKKIKQSKFMKVKEAIHRKYTPNQKHNFYKIQDLEDDKRVWKNDFNTYELQDSEPIFINE
jgi:hypothetical protein